MKSLTRVIDEEIATFIRVHSRKPAVIRLGAIHVQTLRACGVVPRVREHEPCYDDVPIEIAPDLLHVSVA